MKKEIFSQLINSLIEIEPDESPMISCFLNLETRDSPACQELDNWASAMTGRLKGAEVFDFEDAMDEIRDYLSDGILPDSRSVAIYARWGNRPVFLPMQFRVPLGTQFIIDRLPHIYPLIELKDTYHRFVIAILTDTEARILETTIGSITEEILEKRPELRLRAGREWTKEHYHSYCEDQENRFVKEKVALIDRLMKRGGHSYLILAGTPEMISMLKRALPQRLVEKVIDTLDANPQKGISQILTDSIELFVATENIESHSRVRELESAFFSDGLGVCGYEASVEAMESGCASMLILDQNFLELELREQLVRLATQAGIPIETVSGNETMIRLGGVGCLLRFFPAPWFLSQTTPVAV